MQVIYEDKHITNLIEVQKAKIIESAGSVADSVEVVFNDTKGLWGQWKPEKNHKLKLIESGLNSGLMYIDELEQQPGIFVIRALSIPQESKTENTKSWENVRFMEFATKIAVKYGYKLKTFGTQNYLYSRVDQFEQTDFLFLAYRCALEGYVLKVSDQSIVIYDERYMENQVPVKTISSELADGNYGFLRKSNNIYSSGRISYGNLKYQFAVPNSPAGPTLKITDTYVSNQGEAERFIKNLLRLRNKFETTGNILIDLDTSITAGNMIYRSNAGMFEGKYFITKAVHNLSDGKTALILRKPLEGY